MADAMTRDVALSQDELGEAETPCVGHQWYWGDGKPCCVRCGEPAPTSVRLSQDELVEALERAIKRIDALEARIVWLLNQIGDVRGMQSDGATPEQMDEALGRAHSGLRARLLFDQERVSA